MSEPAPRLLSVVPIVPAGADLDATLAFYTQKLGFTLDWRDGGWAGVRRDSAAITLQTFADRGFAANFMYRVKVENPDQLHEEFQRNGVEKLGKPEMKPWGVYEFHVIDPAGVCIHFFK